MKAVERRKRAVELYDQGLSAEKVGHQLGRSATVVLGYLRAEGVQPRRSSASAWEERICARPECGNVFRPSPALIRKGFGKYCSRECDHEAHRIHPRAEERVCARPDCQNRFIPDGFNVAAGWGKYCSSRCSALSTSAHQKKKGRVVACRKCGKEEWRYDCQLTNEHGEFCSRECWNAYRWANGIALDPDRLVSLSPHVVTGRSRQRWLGRWNGKKGAAAGIEAGRAKGGRRPTMTPDQQVQIHRLANEGRSTREIAGIVFGDRRYYKRVQRFLAR